VVLIGSTGSAETHSGLETLSWGDADLGAWRLCRLATVMGFDAGGKGARPMAGSRLFLSTSEIRD